MSPKRKWRSNTINLEQLMYSIVCMQQKCASALDNESAGTTDTTNIIVNDNDASFLRTPNIS